MAGEKKCGSIRKIREKLKSVGWNGEREGRGKDRRIFLMKLLMKFVAEQRGKLRMAIDTALME